MKANKDFSIHDNAPRLSAEPVGGAVYAAPTRCDKSVSHDVCLSNIVRGRISVILSAVVVCSCLMVSCSDSKEQEVLNHVESVIEQHPDSALTILRGVDKTSLGSDKERARYALLMSMALDKNYIDTTTFEVLQPAIDYYLKKGDANEKLQTYYYQGRIFQNKGNIDQALNSFVRGINISSNSNDYLTIARTLVAQACLYQDLYDYKRYTELYLQAAQIFNQISHKNREFECLLNALNGSILLKNKLQADSLINTCSRFEITNEAQKRTLQNYILSYTIQFGSEQEIKEFVCHRIDTLNLSSTANLNLALAYNKLGEYNKALQILDVVNKSEEKYDTLKYQAISVFVYENLGDYKKALSTYIDFSHKTDSINVHKFDKESKAIEDKYKIELKAKETEKQKAQIIWGSISIGLILCIVILIYSLYVKRLKVEHTNDLLRIQNLQATLFENDKRHEKLSNKIESLFATRFKLLDGLASSYFECKETGQEQKRIYAEVKNSIVDFSSDVTTQELNDVVNGYKNGLMDNFKADYPKLSASQNRLALYIFCGFSLSSISIFMGTDLRNIYVYKSRLKSIITTGKTPRKEEYLRYFA